GAPPAPQLSRRPAAANDVGRRCAASRRHSPDQSPGERPRPDGAPALRVASAKEPPHRPVRGLLACRALDPGASGGWCGLPTQWNESPQAQEPVALGLSMVKPCFSMVSTKSITAPLR